MIYVKLHGRIGNHLFQIAAAASLANENNDNFVAICHTDYLLSEPDNCSIWEYTRKFSKNIYRNFEILEHAPINLTEKTYINFRYTPILYENKILLNGAFQSYKYINKKIVQKFFQPTYSIEKSIFSKIGNVLKTKPVSVLVRRGDYLLIPHKFPVVSKNYIKKAMDFFGKERNFLFVSDDIEWCKKNFSGENHFFLETSDILTDLYAQSFCHDNIISNSTFGWWGAYLNQNDDKKVIYPIPWFGKSKETRDHDVSSLCPPNWLPMANKMNLKLRFRSLFLLFVEQILAIRLKFFQKIK